MKKQLAILGAFLAVNTAANAAFDLELKAGAGVYDFVSQTQAASADQKEAFTATWNLSQALQNFGGVAQLNYNVTEGLYIGGGLAVFYDRAFKGKTTVDNVKYTNVEGEDKTADKVTKVSGGKLEGNKITDYNVEAPAKGGFINIPLFASVKYDLPFALESYSMNFYVIGKLGYNLPVTMEETGENLAFGNTFLNFHYGLGLGGEFYGVQLEVLYNGLTQNYKDSKVAPENGENLTLGSMNAGEFGVTRSTFRHGFSLTAGYRMPDLF